MNSSVAEAFENGQKNIEGAVMGTFQNIQPVLMNLTRNMDTLRRQDLRQSAEL